MQLTGGVSWGFLLVGGEGNGGIAIGPDGIAFTASKGANFGLDLGVSYGGNATLYWSMPSVQDLGGEGQAGQAAGALFLKLGISINYSSGYWGFGVSGGEGFQVNLSYQLSKTGVTRTITWEEIGKMVKENPYPMLGLTKEDYKLSDKDLGNKLLNNYKTSLVDLVQKNIDETKQQIDALKQDIEKDKKQLATQEKESSTGLFSKIQKFMTQKRLKENTSSLEKKETKLNALNQVKQSVENMSHE